MSKIIFGRYAHIDLLLFIPDAYGKNRSREFGILEKEAIEKGAKLLCCAACQEVEAWLLAGRLDKLDKPWSAIRADPSVKDIFLLIFSVVMAILKLREGGEKG